MARLNKKCLDRWTQSSIDCYNIGCNCKKCNIVPQDFKCYCKLKSVVRELVRKFGKPNGKDMCELFIS